MTKTKVDNTNIYGRNIDKIVIDGTWLSYFIKALIPLCKLIIFTMQ